MEELFALILRCNCNCLFQQSIMYILRSFLLRTNSRFTSSFRYAYSGYLLFLVEAEALSLPDSATRLCSSCWTSLGLQLQQRYISKRGVFHRKPSRHSVKFWSFKLAIQRCQKLLQIVLPDTLVCEAASKIEGYSAIDPQNLDAWCEPSTNHLDSPFAFPGSIVLESQASESTSSMRIPFHIFVHPASTVHIDIGDQMRSLALSMLPNDDLKLSIRFLTLPALYDSLVDTIFDPPHDFRHYVLEINLKLLPGTLCDSGDDDLDDADSPNYGTSLDDSTGSDAGVDSDDGAGSGDDGYDSDSDDTIWDLVGDLKKVQVYQSCRIDV